MRRPSILVACCLLAVACGSAPEAPGGEWSEVHARLKAAGERGTKDEAEIAFAMDRLMHGSASERSVAAWALGVLRHAPA
jgi:hypothetical protein